MARPRPRRVGCLVAVLIGAGTIVGGVWVVMTARSVAREMLAAEERLHAWILTTDVLADFIRQTSRWPTSWEDLEVVPRQEWSRYVWPDSASELALMVEINFAAGLPPLEPRPDHAGFVHPKGSVSAVRYLTLQWDDVLDAVRTVNQDGRDQPR